MCSLRDSRTPRWILICTLLCCGSVAADDATDPPARVARLSYREGAVSIAPAAVDEWIDAVLNRPLTAGDRVWVDADSRAELQVGTATVHLDQNTGFSFVILDDETLQMRLTDGTMTIHARSLGAQENVSIATSNATVLLRQPGEYSITTDTSGEHTIVKTRSGESEVSGDASRGYRVGAGEEGVFSGRDPLLAELNQVTDRSTFETWANAREDRDVQSIASRYVAPGVIGYRDLDDYGSWSHDVEYGDVWQPTTYAINDWAPYRYGRWVWITPWGWTWIDDAPWGFAPFHYGRWAYLRQRWCWVPGPVHFRPTYAPALVAWVGDPGMGFTDVGWFPLGPREIYLPGYRASWRHFHNVNESNTVFINNTYISNVYYGRGAPVDYHNRRAPHAVTIVPRDTFVSAQRTRGRHVDVDDAHLQHWREQGRAPEISPTHGSVLGAAPARPVHAPRGDRQTGGNSSGAPAADINASSATPPSAPPSAPPTDRPRQWTGTHTAGRPGRSDRPMAPPIELPAPATAAPAVGHERGQWTNPAPTAADPAPAVTHYNRATQDRQQRDRSNPLIAPGPLPAEMPAATVAPRPDTAPSTPRHHSHSQPMPPPTQPDPMISVRTESQVAPPRMQVESPRMQVEPPRNAQERAPQESAPIERANNRATTQERHRQDRATPTEAPGTTPDRGDPGAESPGAAPASDPSNPNGRRWSADQR